MMDAARYCALITLDASGHPRVRAMEPFPPEEDMAVWMATNRNSRKAQEIKNDPRVTLYYAHPQGAGYVTILGTAQLVDDPEEKAHRWKEEWASYYPEGRASYILITVKPSRLEVLDYSKGIVGDPATWTPLSVTF
jgi:general stress protein 26